MEFGRWQLTVYLLIVIAVVGVCLFSFFGMQDDVKHVILISIDTCRADHLSCYGYERVTTPNIDRIAEDGVLFEHAVSPIPLTFPAHCSIFTGTIPPYHGVHNNVHFQLNESNVTLAEILQEQGYGTSAIVSSSVLVSKYGLDQGFDTYIEDFEDVVTGRFGNERRGDETTRLAVEWLEKNKENEAFLFLHYYDPHVAYAPPEPFASEYAGNPYAGEIVYTDQCIGEFIDKLKEQGLYDNSLIVIIGDHGEMLGDHGEDLHSFFIYESAIRVPMIFKLPGGEKSGRVDRAVGLIDVMPTICSIIGADTPTYVGGEDLSVYFGDDSGKPKERYIFSETLVPTTLNANSLMSVSTDRWKYIQTTRPELYDIIDDPLESVNLVEQEPHRARLLQDKLKDILERSVCKNAGSQVDFDSQTIKQLATLGYVATAVDDDFTFRSDKEDPKDLIGFYEEFQQGLILFHEGKFGPAREILERLQTQLPDVYGINSTLAEIAVKEQDFAGAIMSYEKMLEYDRSSTKVLGALGVLNARQGRYSLAIEYFDRAIQNSPDDASLLKKIGYAQASLETLGKKFDELERLMRANPESATVLNNLAWLYATVRDSKLARPDEAVRLAEKACELVGYENMNLLDTLGVSYAAAGHFSDAIEISTKAMVIAGEKADDNLLEEIAGRIEIYKQGKAYYPVDKNN